MTSRMGLLVTLIVLQGYHPVQGQSYTSEPLPPLQSPAQPESGQSEALPMPHEGVRVALLVPLSGPNAGLGQALSNAAQLAVFDTADDQLELLPLDSKGTAQGAIEAFAAARDQGADIILGPVFSQEVKAIAPLARERNIPLIAFTTDKTALAPGIFTLGFLADAQAKAVIDYALAQGRNRFGVLAPDNELGHVMADAAKAAITKGGGDLVREQFYPPATDDFRSIAQVFADYAHHKVALAHDKDLLSGRKGKDGTASQSTMPYDAVFIPDEGVRLKNLTSLLTYYGLDPGPVKFLGTLRWDDPTLAQEPTLEGAWYPAIPEEALNRFQTHYSQSFGTLPRALTGFAGSAYDGVALVALLTKKGSANLTLTTLTDSQGYAGVDGLFRLMPDGIMERGLAIRALAKNGSTEVQGGPDKF